MSKAQPVEWERVLPEQASADDSISSVQLRPVRGQSLAEIRRSAMAQHLNTGFSLLKAERFEAAKLHFQDDKPLTSMGVGTQWGHNKKITRRVPSDISGAKKLVMDAAKENMAYNRDGDLSIKFTNIGLALTPEKINEIKKNHPEQAAILEHLEHENALMAAEECIHTYQNMTGGNYTYHPAADQRSGLDHEIDIAATFERFDVPVTQDFLKRYSGRSGQIQQAEIWNLRKNAAGKIVREKNEKAPLSPAMPKTAKVKNPPPASLDLWG